METLYKKIEDLDLSIRTKKLLRNAGINTLQEVSSYTKSDLMKFRNFGRSGLVELEDLMLKNNLSFGTVETIKSDNTQTLENASKQIEKLEAENKELLEALDNLTEYGSTGEDAVEMKREIESLIQKHKK